MHGSMNIKFVSDSCATTVCSVSGGVYVTTLYENKLLGCHLLYWFAVILTLNLIKILVNERMHTVIYQIRDWLLISTCTLWIVSTNSRNLLCPALGWECTVFIFEEDKQLIQRSNTIKLIQRYNTIIWSLLSMHYQLWRLFSIFWCSKSIYRIHMSSDNNYLTLHAAALPCMWALVWIGYVYVINKATGGSNC
jgi:hypothetical protein